MELGNPIKQENLEYLIDALFEDDPEVYEAYSQPDHELRKFGSKQEVLEYIKEVEGRNENLVYLSIHYPETKGYVRIKKIDLKPEKCNGAKTRFSTEGWGLVQFQLWLKDTGLFCDIGSNSEKRALKWESTYPELKSPELWNWKEVGRQCRRLKRVLKKCA